VRIPVATGFLVGCGGSEGGVNGDAADGAFGQYWLDVTASIFGENGASAARFALAVGGLGEEKHAGVENYAFGVEEKFFGNGIFFWFFLRFRVVFILLVFFVFLLVFWFVLFLF
jgi:hypothetical protein